MAELLQKNIKHGLDIPPEQLARLVKEDYQREVMSIVSNSDAKQILSMFGDDVVNKIRKHDLEQLRNRPVNSSAPTAPKESSNESRYMTPDEFRSNLNKKLK